MRRFLARPVCLSLKRAFMSIHRIGFSSPRPMSPSPLCWPLRHSIPPLNMFQPQQRRTSSRDRDSRGSWKSGRPGCILLVNEVAVPCECRVGHVRNDEHASARDQRREGRQRAVGHPPTVVFAAVLFSCKFLVDLGKAVVRDTPNYSRLELGVERHLCAGVEEGTACGVERLPAWCRRVITMGDFRVMPGAAALLDGSRSRHGGCREGNEGKNMHSPGYLE